MDSYLDELYAHQEWADAEHWRAIEAHPAALADKAIRERLAAYPPGAARILCGSPDRGPAPFAFKKLEDFRRARPDLKHYAQRYHTSSQRDATLLQSMQTRLEAMIEAAVVPSRR
jgi:hypothetical protein